MKVVELIKSLSSSEIEGFKKFIYSPYFNESKDIIKLFESFIYKFCCTSQFVVGTGCITCATFAGKHGDFN